MFTCTCHHVRYKPGCVSLDFLACVFLGCTGNAQSSPKLKVLGETFSLPSFCTGWKNSLSDTLCFGAAFLYTPFQWGFLTRSTLYGSLCSKSHLGMAPRLKPQSLHDSEFWAIKTSNSPKGSYSFRVSSWARFSSFSFILVHISLPFFFCQDQQCLLEEIWYVYFI